MNNNDFYPVEPFEEYLLSLHRDIVSARPPLIEAARKIDGWWCNGKTGDILNVSMPTRFGKSLLSTAFSSWLIVSDERLRILRASYSSDLAEAFSLQVRYQVDKYYGLDGLFGMTFGTRARWRITGFPQDNHAGVGIGGGITGFGFDIAIVDDTAKNMLEATSAAYSRQLKVFKESVLLGRLEGRRKILNVGTRWTVNDWFSMWPDADEYVLPAMIDGRSCCEAWKTTEELELERSRVSEAVWNAQYMQRPTETGRIRIFEEYRPEQVSALPDGERFLVIDPSTAYGSDYFVIGYYLVCRGMVYLIDIFARQQYDLKDVAAWIKGKEYRVAYIEANGVGRDICTKLQRDYGVRSLVGFATTADKYSRATVQRDAILNYFRIFAACDPQAVGELLREFDTFPVSGDNIHDDLLDNVIMAFEKLLNR